MGHINIDKNILGPDGPTLLDPKGEEATAMTAGLVKIIQEEIVTMGSDLADDLNKEAGLLFAALGLGTIAVEIETPVVKVTFV